jgi:hypothetical protein
MRWPSEPKLVGGDPGDGNGPDDELLRAIDYPRQKNNTRAQFPTKILKTLSVVGFKDDTRKELRCDTLCGRMKSDSSSDHRACNLSLLPLWQACVVSCDFFRR